jgi:hypothetical protein
MIQLSNMHTNATRNVTSTVTKNFVNKNKKITIGRMKRSYFGGLRVNPSPTKQTLVTILFHAFPVKVHKRFLLKSAGPVKRQVYVQVT